SANRLVGYREVSAGALVVGVSGGYFDAGAYRLLTGQTFGTEAVTSREQVAVLDEEAAKTLFPDGVDPLGTVIQVGRVPLRVIGTVAPTGTVFGSQSIRVFVPYTTAATRITGDESIDSIAVRVDTRYSMTRVEALMTELMLQRHGTQDFFLTNSDTIRETITSA